MMHFSRNVRLAFVAASLLLIAFMAVAQPNQSLPQTTLSPDKIQKVSVAFGHMIARNLQQTGVHFNMDLVVEGMRDSMAGKECPIPQAEFEQLVGQVEEEALRNVSTTNLDVANRYLENNAKVAGVVELQPKQLQYRILKTGSGSAVVAHSAPLVNYWGRYADGTPFSSTEETGGPISIPLDHTIPGFGRALVGMLEGERREIVIHPDLAYGVSGPLPPNSLLIFEVEVVKADSKESVWNTPESSAEPKQEVVSAPNMQQAPAALCTPELASSGKAEPQNHLTASSQDLPGTTQPTRGINCSSQQELTEVPSLCPSCPEADLGASVDEFYDFFGCNDEACSSLSNS